ncbi:uncharacterized protein SPAPADRAFT_61876 [Spathaspora passalidarum NRRL Y-27907]|uniref:PUM-HD domain-containing protein n=1 Tax=Spathaspora passalidarum (strain NRRL Y-27907 / 11-Y1) TaxID=619300 RepID=G3ARI5_SPAPN|nr:uncharacterized protein SPAPADRAFT_61876 [Spathaspora passalidarum NRRL Y-27907]EGW31306.1 hypothetical protein SPAPADRAFT_61876 [Spathaspora passalidarum NRRL Y-27907]
MSTFIPQSINQQQLPPPQGPHFPPPPPPHHTILGPYPGTYPPPVPTPPEFRQFDNSPMNPPMIPGAPNANMWTSQIMTPPPGANMRNSNYIDHTLMHQPMMNNTNHGGNRYNTHRYPHRGNFDGMNTHRKNNGKPRRGDDASKYANAKLSDFVGDILNLCKDQHGCRFLQRQLELDEGAATIIFQEIYFKIVELMIDPFGNYLIQKLFEHITVEQRIVLVKNASGEFMKISMDPHGTRALQKLIECISTAEESKLIIEALQPHIVILSRDLNGNHVVQKCLQNLKTSDNQFIFDAVCANCLAIATHRHGCCVLQRCLDHGDPLQRQQLSLKIAENATKLAIDPFGNYVVQYVLSHGDDKSIEIILNHIKSNTIALSLHKFGSNVIEKSLRINKLSNQLIEVLLLNESRFEELLNDGFGNYVLQTSLDVASPTDLARLSQSLIPLLPNIKNTPHGRRIMNKLQSME